VTHPHCASQSMYLLNTPSATYDEQLCGFSLILKDAWSDDGLNGRPKL